MKNEQQSQNLLLKVDPGSTLSNNFLQPATNVSVSRQVGIDQKLETQQCCATSLGFLYPVFRRLKVLNNVFLNLSFKRVFFGRFVI